MRCPKCLSNEWTCVLNTVQRNDGITRRRLGCRRCQIRWSTVEDFEPGSIVSAPVPRPAVPPLPRTEADLSREPSAG